jgi:nicotinate phosphoribosyltransferase
MAHSFVEAMESEEESFRAYAGSFPDSSTFLVDTYDTVAGVRQAISVAREMQRRGHSLRAVRLDSGNVLELSVRARALLDEAGLERVQVFVTGGMDEFQVEALLERGAPIDGFGIGAKVGVSADAPLTDCIYKLVEYQGRPTLKLSAGKQTLPCPKQVFRVRDDRGQYREDVICLAGEEPPDGGPQALLEDVMMRGRRVSQPQSLQVLRERFKEEFAGLPEQHKRLHSPAEYRVSISPALEALNWETTATFQRRESGGR